MKLVAPRISSPLGQKSVPGLTATTGAAPPTPDAAPFGAYVEAILHCAEDGKVGSVNGHAKELLGNQLIGKQIEEFFSVRDRAVASILRSQCMAQNLKAAGYVSASLVAIRKDGQEFEARCTFEPLEYQRGRAMLVRIQPAHQERRRNPIQLPDDIQYRFLIENLPDYAIYLLDPDGRVATWNIGAQKIKGYSPIEILGESYARFFTPEDNKASIPDKLLHLAAETGRVEREGWRVRKDGSRFWAHGVLTAIREGDKLVGFAKITRDATENKQVEDIVKFQLSQAFHSSPNSFRVLDVVSATLHSVVPHDCAILGTREADGDTFRMRFLDSGEPSPRHSDILLPAKLTVAAKVLSDCEPMILPNFAEAEELQEALSPIMGIGMASGCWVPLQFESHPIGVLVVASRRKNAFQPHHARILVEVAKQVAVVVRDELAFHRATPEAHNEWGERPNDGPQKTTLESAEREFILRVLRSADGKIDGHAGAAAQLGLKRSTLYSKMKKLRITRSDYR